MANSVVKVTDVRDDINDSLLLLVGEDGTVMPDKETVEMYLSSKSGPTKLQIMHIDKSDSRNIDLSVDNVTFMPESMEVANTEDVIIREDNMDEVARNLYNFKLDHDYTTLTSPRRLSLLSDDVDELTKTLSILHGSEDHQSSEPSPIVITVPPHTPIKSSSNVNIISSITIPPSTLKTPVKSAPVAEKLTPVQTPEAPPVPVAGEDEAKPLVSPPKPKSRLKIVHVQQNKSKSKSPPKSKKIKKVEEEEEPDDEADDLSEEEEEYDEADFDMGIEDDENDSDFDIEGEIKGKSVAKRRGRKPKSEANTPSSKPIRTTPKSVKARKTKIKDGSVTPKSEVAKKDQEKVAERTDSKQETSEEVKPVDAKSETPETKQLEKKPPKKEKKPPKPIPNDFVLFSTPDIIRRVGGKEPTTPSTPETINAPKLNKTNESAKLEKPTEPMVSCKPAKILQESRSKSVNSENSQSPTKHRHSVDGKISMDKEKVKEKQGSHHRSSTENRSKERTRQKSVEEKSNKTELKNTSESTKQENKNIPSLEKLSQLRQASESLEHMPSAEDVRAIIMNEDTRTYTTNTIPIPDVNIPAMESNNLNLDGAGLDLDQSILDNINNDMISEDLLYQVAQQLVSNTDIQNAIDKGINEGVLDTRSIQEAMEVQDQLSNSASLENTSDSDVVKEGTQIVRPDGRIVVIPPIERPTTRSRNKRKDDSKPPFKTVHKPLDDEHVSGNELDSPNEEEESEDDPNKLWCICNQPHNNRFMICCDTCEEWYHGKCVNITKAMGQQMESEGKEWICLFCKNPSLKRPLAAARRVRKASRNSRTSTDSNNSSKKIEKEKSGGGSVPCVVCQKPARKNSIYCSENCILTHAQGIERVVVFDRSTGNMLTGSKAPSSVNLDQWLKEHPGYEVVKSAGKAITTKVKPASLTQSKLKLVKNSNNEGVSLAVQQKGVNIGVLKHAPKNQTSQDRQSPQQYNRSLKIIKLTNKEGIPKESKTKLIQAQPLPPVKSQTVTPSKPKTTIQTTLTLKTPKSKEVPKEKPLLNKTPRTKHKEREEQTSTTPQSNQENIRENVQKTIFEQLIVRLKSDPNIKLTDEEVKNISIDIEAELHKCFGDTGHKYKNKYRSLIFNIKDAKNQTLWRRICEKTISSYELVRLSPDDMASQELAKWREQEAKHQLDMIKKSELELLNSSRQYVLKTHKGEEILEDNRLGAKGDNAEIIKSLTEGSPLDAGDKEKDKDKDRDRDRKSSKHSRKDKSRDRERSSKDKKESHKSRRSSSHDREKTKRRSRTRDRSRHSEKKKEKRSRSRSRDKEKHKRSSSHKNSKHKRSSSVTNDNLDKRSKEILEQLNKIAPPVEDRLWKHVPQEDIVPGIAPMDSDSDHEIPSSTVTIPTPPRIPESDEYQPTNQSSNDSKSSLLPTAEQQNEGGKSPPLKVPATEIWSGTINMVDVAQISITAHEVSGDCTKLDKELPSNLDIVGRISPDTVWDYIGKMKCSNSKVISLVRLNATNVEEQMPYLALYSYLSSRNRLGVVKSTNKAIKDFYILPLASQKPIPQALLPLNGPGFEESRPALLLGIIIRDKRKRPFLEPPSVPVHTPKKLKVDVIIQPPLPTVTAPRSYTPPPMPPPTKSDPRLSKLPLPPPTPPEEIEGGVCFSPDEPYSPEDSDPETTAAGPTLVITPPAITSVPPPALPETNLSVETYTPIPGLGDGLPSSKLDIQRQMDELNYKIEMQKFEITSITKNIATAGSEIGPSALANIALPSNLQQILESIKTIGSGNDSTEKEPPIPGTTQTDLTIPLMIPKTFTRPLSAAGHKSDIDTIPLNLPSKPKIKPHSVNSPLYDNDRSGSVLSSLTEEDLIRKAAEMLKEDEPNKLIPPPNYKTTPPPVFKSAPPVNYKTTPPPIYKSTPPPNFAPIPPTGFSEPPPSIAPPSKKTKYEVQLPPVPGID